MDSEEERAALFAALGEAITEWAQIEDWLCILYTIATDCTTAERRPLAAASFFAVVSSEAKIKMVEAAWLRRFQGTDYRDRWAALSKSLQSKLKIRNTIAHAHITEWPDRVAGQRYGLGPSAHDTREKYVTKSPPFYRLHDLRGIIRGFRNLTSELRALSFAAGEFVLTTRQPPE